MSDIKFRAWDNNKKEYELFDSLYELQKANKTPEELENFTFEQYTGRKDKNGKEIYEGDICKSGGMMRVVKFENCSFCFGQTILLYVYRLEIVGDIHRNPELLERVE